LKDFDEKGFVFFTNYESRKGRELDENPYAVMVFFWAELERQVRIDGRVSRISREESEEYFHTRPLGSQLGAWASRQSEVIGASEHRELIRARISVRRENHPMPSYWGGFLLAGGIWRPCAIGCTTATIYPSPMALSALSCRHGRRRQQVRMPEFHEAGNQWWDARSVARSLSVRGSARSTSTRCRELCSPRVQPSTT
jgi:hypothetical protein